VGSELSRTLSEVAEAVTLQEGEAGVRQILRAIGQLEPASTRAVSRQTGLPVPVVAAVSNELRARGLVTRERPAKLTPRGRELLGGEVPDLRPAVVCPCCQGWGLADGPLAGLAGELAEMMAASPAADVSLDQSHSTAETKVRRVLYLLRHGLLPAPDLLLLGDDDLMAITVAMAGAKLGYPLAGRYVVVDVAPDYLDFIRDRLAGLGVSAEIAEHDLRKPLAGVLNREFELVMTDPPYTVEGARLFLSRAVEVLRPGPGRAIAFSFGTKGPEDTLRVQEAITELGLTVAGLHRDFNSYHGASVIGGRSNLYHLVSAQRTKPLVVGEYQGKLYTAQARAADRVYRCLQCGARHVVGPGASWRTIGELKQAGCPACGGQRLRPLQLAPRT
jgi:predicted methyltransferase/DNA-directed RNA polymerase subunit RPC12/RpoP